MLHGLWDLSSPTGDRTQALGSESEERGVLTTGLPGNSHRGNLFYSQKFEFHIIFMS